MRPALKGPQRMAVLELTFWRSRNLYSLQEGASKLRKKDHSWGLPGQVPDWLDPVATGSDEITNQIVVTGTLHL
ncbi:hypothetical protein Y1Q_0008708 [Alligator mississippiensis]|uniref:Uncharacterized protein n=1 Tax=Alligator mississippiensis TaxID=8496 RepID=A0A151N9N4_ALLMI|nr:hypothetical protein Y1Q_0008708 [Alligator mississippiensis]